VDPNATLAFINDAVMEVDDEMEPDTIGEACDELGDWIDGGGFPPDWSQFPAGTAYFNWFVARAN